MKPRRPVRVVHRAVDVGGRVPKHDVDAERLILAHAIEHPECLDDVLSINRPEHFSLTAHQRVFETIVSLRQSSKLVEFGTVALSLRERELLEAVGGVAFLSSLLASPTVADIRIYSRAIASLYQRGQIVAAAQQIVGQGLVGDEDDEEFVAHAVDAISKAAERTETTEIELAYDVGMRRMLELSEQWQGKRSAFGIPSGLPELDRLTGGFRMGALSIVAGATGGGKSAFTLQIARFAATTFYNGARVGVALVSLEMSKDEITDRAVCQIAGINDKCLQEGLMSEQEGERFDDAIRQFTTLPIALYDSETDLQKIRWVVRGAQQKFERHASDPNNPCRLRLVIIDYLQLVNVDSDADSRAEALSRLTRGLKLMAGELDIHIMVLCQFNRVGMNRPDSLPQLWDLKESSSIEQDANLVLFVHRPYAVFADKACAEAQRRIDEARIIVAKNRKGATGDVPVRFVGEFLRFESPSPTDLERWKQRPPRRERRSIWEPRGGHA